MQDRGPLLAFLVRDNDVKWWTFYKLLHHDYRQIFKVYCDATSSTIYIHNGKADCVTACFLKRNRVSLGSSSM